MWSQVHLLVILSTAHATGEYCHGWFDTHGGWHVGFQCPELYDGDEALFCCGNCHLRYCCTAAEARLDQGSCDNDKRDLEEEAETVQAVPTYLPFLIVCSLFVAFVIIGTFIAICCCRCLKMKTRDQHGRTLPTQCRLTESGHSSESQTPSRHSSSSSSTASRCSLGGRNQNNICTVGTDGLNLFMNLPPQGTYPILSCPQSQGFMATSQASAPFLQPYIGYRMPPEQTMLMGPTYADNRGVYGRQQPPHSFQQMPMHTEALYPGVTM
uniref:Shisa family member 2a n=1 Tax=Erpetoichthys calabaricus TaxID=27687 RepID=A0A8C4SHT6_ERPCA